MGYTLDQATDWPRWVIKLIRNANFGGGDDGGGGGGDSGGGDSSGGGGGGDFGGGGGDQSGSGDQSGGGVGGDVGGMAGDAGAGAAGGASGVAGGASGADTSGLGADTSGLGADTAAGAAAGAPGASAAASDAAAGLSADAVSGAAVGAVGGAPGASLGVAAAGDQPAAATDAPDVFGAITADTVDIPPTMSAPGPSGEGDPLGPAGDFGFGPPPPLVASLPDPLPDPGFPGGPLSVPPPPPPPGSPDLSAFTSEVAQAPPTPAQTVTNAFNSPDTFGLGGPTAPPGLDAELASMLGLADFGFVSATNPAAPAAAAQAMANSIAGGMTTELGFGPGFTAIPSGGEIAGSPNASTAGDLSGFVVGEPGAGFPTTSAPFGPNDAAVQIGEAIGSVPGATDKGSAGPPPGGAGTVAGQPSIFPEGPGFGNPNLAAGIPVGQFPDFGNFSNIFSTPGAGAGTVAGVGSDAGGGGGVSPLGGILSGAAPPATEAGVTLADGSVVPATAVNDAIRQLTAQNGGTPPTAQQLTDFLASGGAAANAAPVPGGAPGGFFSDPGLTGGTAVQFENAVRQLLENRGDPPDLINRILSERRGIHL